MINCGLLKYLDALIFSENVQIQTKSLAVLQYLDGTGYCRYKAYGLSVVHQQKLIDQGILEHLMKLVAANKVPLQLKALSVIQHFEGTLISRLGLIVA